MQLAPDFMRFFAKMSVFADVLSKKKDAQNGRPLSFTTDKAIIYRIMEYKPQQSLLINQNGRRYQCQVGHPEKARPAS